MIEPLSPEEYEKEFRAIGARVAQIFNAAAKICEGKNRTELMHLWAEDRLAVEYRTLMKRVWDLRIREKK